MDKLNASPHSNCTDAELILKAAVFAARFHADQKRKTSGDPYINHLLRVAWTAAKSHFSSEMIAAALLHDVIEDTNATYDELETDFPPRVVQLVRLLTQWWEDHAAKDIKESEVPKYYNAILKDPDAISLKLLDRADNLNDMADTISVAPKWAMKYLEKSRVEMKPLLESDLASPEAISVCEAALKKLSSAVQRYRDRTEKIKGKNQDRNTKAVDLG